MSAGKEHWRTLGLAFGRQAPQKSGGPHVKAMRRCPALNFAASLWDTAFFRPDRRRVAGPMQPHRAARRFSSETKKPQVSRSTQVLQQPARGIERRSDHQVLRLEADDKGWPQTTPPTISEPSSASGLATTGSNETSEYGFLLRYGLDAKLIHTVVQRAEDEGVQPHELLVASGFLSEIEYVGALAQHLGVAFISGRSEQILVPDAEPLANPKIATARSDVAGGDWVAVLDGMAHGPLFLQSLVVRSKDKSVEIALATRRTLSAAAGRDRWRHLVRDAAGGLARRAPELSASSGLWLAQAVLLAVLIGLELGGFLVVPRIATLVLALIITLPFLMINFFRTAGIISLFAGERAITGLGPKMHRQSKELPVYTILCPLFAEAAVLPQLVQALKNLDYSPAKLDIKLVLEEVDKETQEVARSLDLPASFEIIVVPDGRPRTKPKALNYALKFARGRFVVVYDAEDLPERDQLLRVLDVFDRSPPDVGCVQARLVIHNVDDSWITRQFALVYLALFDCLLPTYERLAFEL